MSDPVPIRRTSTPLPQPLYLWERLSDSPHFHFGYFDEPDERIATAFDRLVEQCVGDLPPGSRVLDVGCGLGGTSAMLAARGHDVTGIDPSEAVITYALDHLAGARARYSITDFESQPRTTPTRSYDAIVMIEVLQHLQLAEAMSTCHELLAIAGTLIVCDVTKEDDICWSRLPFHRRGTLQAAARAAGMEQTWQRDITEFVVPTLPRMMELVTSSRASIIGEIGPSRPSVGEDLDELFEQLRHLRDGFENRDLRYEIAVFRRPAPTNGLGPSR